MLGVSETDGDGDAEDHEHPVDLRDVDLAMDLVGGVNHFDSGEAAECLALAYDGEGAAYDSLAPNHGCKYGDYEHRPSH